MNFHKNLISFVFLFLFRSVHSAHIGLFASTGCYSHDILMRQFADRLISRQGGAHRVTVIQIRVYEFISTVAAPNSTVDIRPWNHLAFDGCSNSSMSLLRRLQRQMWTNLVPYDPNSFDLEGVRILLSLHDHHKIACFNALRDESFVKNLKGLRLDLLVTDYVLNECALRFSDLLDVNLAYFSNYPVLSSYAVDLGFSSNPSYVPSVIGFETSRMAFARRAFNSFLYFVLWSTRQWFDFDVRSTFKRHVGYRFSKTKASTAAHRRVLSFSTPFEALVDVARPVARNLHYFGCDHCFGDNREQNAYELLNISSTGNDIVLVSFGTVTKGDQIPIVQLQRLVRTFGRFPSLTFVWQLDVTWDYFQHRVLKPIDYSMPPNVRLFLWIPLKQLLADDRVILLINHGGISSCLEALHHAVPVLGVALQGDQGYNLRRLVDRGVAEMLSISDLTEEFMRQKLSTMISQIHRYKASVLKLRRMVIDHKSLYNSTQSTFLMGWIARHFGRQQNASNVAVSAQRYLILRYPSNWLVYYSLDILLVPLLFAIIAVSFYYTSKKRYSKKK